MTNSRYSLPRTGIPFERKGTEKRKTEFVEFESDRYGDYIIKSLTEVEDYGKWIEIEDGDGMVGVYEGIDPDLQDSIVEVFFGEDGFTRLLIPKNNL